MAGTWQSWLERWQSAGLIEPAAAEAIRRYEAARAPLASHRIALFAFAFGGLLREEELIESLIQKLNEPATV